MFDRLKRPMWLFEEDGGSGGSGEDPIEELVVDGETVRVPKSELKKGYQKALAADKRFREASEIKKQYEGAKEKAEKWDSMKRDLELARQGDFNAIRRLTQYEALGVDQERAEAAIRYLDEQRRAAADDDDDDGDDESGGEGLRRGRRSQEGPLEFEGLPERARAAIEKQEREEADRIKGQIKEQIKVRLATDKDVGYALEGKGNARKLERLADYALADLQEKVRQVGRFSPEVLERAVQDTKQYAQDLEIVPGPEDTSAPGSPGLGRAPTTSSGVLRKPTERPKRLPPEKILNTSDYAENIMQRIAHGMLGKKEE